MATGGSLGNLVRCSLCHEEYKNPRALSCSHSFCEECLKEHVSNNTKPGDTFDCPECEESIPVPKEGVSAFRLNHDLSKLLDVLATVRITEGTMKNDASTETEPNSTSFGEANVTTGVDPFCNIHPQKDTVMYCEGCEEAVCLACIGGQHKGHDIIELKEAAQECKKWLSESTIAMTQQDNLCVEENTALKKDREEAMAAADEIITQVRGHCTDLCQQISATTEEVVTKLTKQCEEIKSAKNTKMENNNMLSSRLRNSIAMHHVVQKTEDYMSVIQGKRDLQSQVNQLRKEEPESLEEKIRWNFIPGALNTASSWYLVGRLEKKDELKQIPGALDIGTDKNRTFPSVFRFEFPESDNANAAGFSWQGVPKDGTKSLKGVSIGASTLANVNAASSSQQAVPKDGSKSLKGVSIGANTLANVNAAGFSKQGVPNDGSKSLKGVSIGASTLANVNAANSSQQAVPKDGSKSLKGVSIGANTLANVNAAGFSKQGVPNDGSKSLKGVSIGASTLANVNAANSSQQGVPKDGSKSLKGVSIGANTLANVNAAGFSPGISPGFSFGSSQQAVPNDGSKSLKGVSIGANTLANVNAAGFSPGISPGFSFGSSQQAVPNDGSK